MRNDAFGIDHPLIAVHDIEGVRSRLCALGFNMTPVGRHPWGTSTSLAIFDGCLLEIMGIHDESLLDDMPAGDFRFGRHVQQHLEAGEGIALTALHSRQAIVDAARAEAAGLRVSGTLEFGRDVILPDGTPDRTRTTLALMPDAQFPRLSTFLCQQHRPELVYVPDWMDHSNTVFGISGITILAAARHHQVLGARLASVQGPVTTTEGGFFVQTANGVVSVLEEAAIRRDFIELPDEFTDATSPMIVAMDFRCRSLPRLRRLVGQAGHGIRQAGEWGILQRPELFGNTLFRFSEQADNRDEPVQWPTSLHQPTSSAASG